MVSGTIATGAHTRTPLTGGWVGLVSPKGGPWIGLAPFGQTNIDKDGTYYFRIFLSNIEALGDYPVFLAASDAGETFTMLAELPADLAKEDADVTIDINPTTTVASLMICPGGVYPPPANAWCYSDPKTPSTSNTGMISLLDQALAGSLISLQATPSLQWGPFASGFLDDAPTFAAIKSNLTDQGIPLGTATPTSILSMMTAASLPVVRLASSGGSSGSSGTSGTSGTSGGAGCVLKWDCKTSTQCASVYGKPTGTAAQPDAATCASTCKSQGACTCQGC